MATRRLARWHTPQPVSEAAARHRARYCAAPSAGAECAMDILPLLDRFLAGDHEAQMSVLSGFPAVCKANRGVLEATAGELVPRLRDFILTEESLFSIELAGMLLPYFGRTGVQVVLDLLEHDDLVGVAFAAACGVGEFSPAEAWTIQHLHALARRGRFFMSMHAGMLVCGLAGIGPCVPYEPLRRQMMERFAT